MINIEMLYPEICNLYGDYANAKYLASCIKDVKVINTNLTNKPKFATEDVDFLYLGSMTERDQEIVIEKLLPYKDRIKDLIKKNKVILFTGNAVEILGNYIEKDDGTKINALGILNFYAKRQMLNRVNSLILGTFEDIKIVGFKSQFTLAYGDNSKNYFAKIERGFGLNKETDLEGFRKKNLFATYLLGPLLPLNPKFTKYILRLLKVDDSLKFEEEAMTAYDARLVEFEDRQKCKRLC